MGKAEVGHHSGAPERHRVNGGQVRRKGKDLLDRGDRLLDVAAAQAGERPHAPAHDASTPSPTAATVPATSLPRM